MNFKYFVFYVLINSFHICCSAASFEDTWHKMQVYYTSLKKSIAENGISNNIEQKYCHPSWLKNKELIYNLIKGAPNKNFLKFSHIGGTMVRTGMNRQQIYEICHLQQCTSTDAQKILNFFHEGYHEGIPLECKQYNCTANSLGQLFYASKIFDINPNLNSIVEFGSGFGSLAHIFKKCLPESTIILIDLPELLAIQYLYLSLSGHESEIVIHSVPPKEFSKGKIHLIPTFYAEKLDIHPDLFISNFALSECPTYVQDIISKKSFFNAPICYITGQLNGWNQEFVSHENIHNIIRKNYPLVELHPFHLMMEQQNLYSYELIGIKYK